MSNTPKIKAAGPGKAPSASEQAIAVGAKEVSAVDARGRLIVLRKPTTWERFSLPRILGQDAMNPAWQLQALMMLHVKQVGEDIDTAFGSVRELKSIIDMLGDDGYETVNTLYTKHFMGLGAGNAAATAEMVVSMLEGGIPDDALNKIEAILKENLVATDGEVAKNEIKNS